MLSYILITFLIRSLFLFFPFALGYFGNVRKQTFEIFDTEANVLEAFEFCKVNGMVKANTNPFTFKYVRAKLQEFGWLVFDKKKTLLQSSVLDASQFLLSFLFVNVFSVSLI